MMSTHAYRYLAPLGVHDVKMVMIDVKIFARQVLNASLSGYLYVPSGSRSSRYQNQEQPFEDGVLRQMFLGNFMFTNSRFAVNDRYPVFLTIGLPVNIFQDLTAGDIRHPIDDTPETLVTKNIYYHGYKQNIG